MGDVVAFGFIAFGIATVWSAAWAVNKVRADERAMEARIRQNDGMSALIAQLGADNRAFAVRLLRRRVRWPVAQWFRS